MNRFSDSCTAEVEDVESPPRDEKEQFDVLHINGKIHQTNSPN